MRRWSQVLLISTVLSAAAFLSAPWFAMRGLQAAARDGDVQALAELIDYPAVRAGLRADPQAQSLEAPASVWSDPVGAVRQALERRRPAPPEAERYLSPAGLQVLAGPPEFGHEVRHWGPNRVRFAARTGERVSLFTFQRRGLFRWRLVHLSPPPVSARFRSTTAPAPVR